jgi:hypothetical protein
MLRARQVNVINRTIRLDPGTTKNGDGREVTMTPKIAELLRLGISGKRPDDFVLPRNGKPVRDFRRTWANLCVRAGQGEFDCRDCGQPVTAIKEMQQVRQPQAQISRADRARPAALGGEGTTRGRCARVGHHGNGRVENCIGFSPLCHRQFRRPACRYRNAGARKGRKHKPPFSAFRLRNRLAASGAELEVQ